MLSQKYPSIKFKVILVDVSSVLLEEALKRYSNFKIKVDTKAIQLNLHDNNAIQKVANKYKNSADFLLSVKFLHNTNIKINKKIAHMISTLLKKGGIFVVQFYCATIKDNWLKQKIAAYLMFALGRQYKYGNSILADRIWINHHLKQNNLRLIYNSISKNKDKSFLKVNSFYKNQVEKNAEHFFAHQIENYYVKTI